MTFYTFSKIKRRIGRIGESKKMHFFLQKSEIFFHFLKIVLEKTGKVLIMTYYDKKSFLDSIYSFKL